MRALVKAAGAAATLSFTTCLFSCTQVLGIEETTFEAPKVKPVPPGDWSCLGNIAVQKPEAGVTSGNITISLINYVTGKPAPNIKIQACGSVTDLDCSQTKQGTAVLSDAEGKATIPVEIGTNGFQGYLEINDSETDAMKQISVPYLVFFPKPIIGNFDIPRFFVVSPAALSGLHMAVGASIDPMRGQFSTSPFDCADAIAAGATLRISSADAQTTRWYLIDPGGGNPPQLDTQVTKFDAVGLGGFFNVPVGLLTADIVLSDDRIASTVKVQVRAGYFSSLDMKPNITK